MGISPIWDSYMKMLTDHVKNSSWSGFYLFSNPSCGTCEHWRLILEQLLEELSPDDARTILQGVEGEIKPVKENGEIVDTFRDVTYHGFCKRSPPFARGGSSIVYSKFPLFSFTRRLLHIPNRITKFCDWPITPHDQFCGEWKKGSWVDDYLAKNGIDPVTRQRVEKTSNDTT